MNAVPESPLVVTCLLSSMTVFMLGFLQWGCPSAYIRMSLYGPSVQRSVTYCHDFCCLFFHLDIVWILWAVLLATKPLTVCISHLMMILSTECLFTWVALQSDTHLKHGEMKICQCPSEAFVCRNRMTMLVNILSMQLNILLLHISSHKAKLASAFCERPKIALPIVTEVVYLDHLPAI